MATPPLHAFIRDIAFKVSDKTIIRWDTQSNPVVTIKPGREQKVENLLQEVRTYINRPEVDINQKDGKGFTILHYAYTPILNKMLRNDPRLTIPLFNAKEERLKNLLEHPQLDTTEVRKLAKDKEVDLNKEDEHRMTLFDIALGKTIRNDLLSILLNSRKVDINRLNMNGQTPLIYVVKRDFPIFPPMLEYPGIDINMQDTSGKTALDYATEKIANTYRSEPIDIKRILEQNFKLLLHNAIYDSKKIEDILMNSRLMDYQKKEFIEYLGNIKKIKRQMVSEVATMSGTNVSSNVQSRTLPQLPPGVSGKIYEFLSNNPKKEKPVSEATKRYQERVAREKEAEEQRKQADIDYRNRNASEVARGSFPANQNEDTIEYQGNNPLYRGGRKTRRKPISARYSRHGKRSFSKKSR